MGILTIGAIAASVMGYVIFSMRSAAATGDQAPRRAPILLGSILAGSSAAALVGAIQLIWQVVSVYSPRGDADLSPRVPWDIVVILGALFIWIAFETLRKVLSRQVLPPSQEARIYAKAQRDVSENIDEVRQAIARDDGVSTVQLLIDAHSAASTASRPSVG
jgi:hypothetical protein